MFATKRGPTVVRVPAAAAVLTRWHWHHIFGLQQRLVRLWLLLKHVEPGPCSLADRERGPQRCSRGLRLIRT